MVTTIKILVTTAQVPNPATQAHNLLSSTTNLTLDGKGIHLHHYLNASKMAVIGVVNVDFAISIQTLHAWLAKLHMRLLKINLTTNEVSRSHQYTTHFSLTWLHNTTPLPMQPHTYTHPCTATHTPLCSPTLLFLHLFYTLPNTPIHLHPNPTTLLTHTC